MAHGADWSVSICFSLSFGAWMCGILWVLAREPWSGVFGCGVCVGWLLMDRVFFDEAKRALEHKIKELEKQVIVLRSRLTEISLGHSELEAQYRRVAFRHRDREGTSSSASI